MSYRPVPVEKFGGLNLVDDPAEVPWTQAIDLLNVDVDKRGRVRSRYGYEHLTSSAAASAYLDLFAPTPGGQLLAGRGDQIDGITLGTGAVDDTLASTGSGLSGWSFTNFGAPAGAYTYCQNSTATTRRWDGSAFSSPTATVDGSGGSTMPKVAHVCAWPTQGRLVAAGGLSGAYGPGGATSSGHHVWFSEPGDAESWLTTNFVQVMPGDSESIATVVNWNNNIYVIKQTRMFEFYGVSTDGSGNPIFNYRTITLPSRVASNGPDEGGATVSPGGIYIATGRGVYRYNGSFQLISAAVDPIWLNTATSFYQGTVHEYPSLTTRLFWADERLYVVLVNSASTYRTLVWDAQADAWLLWDAPAKGFARVQPSVTEARIVFASASANHVEWFKSSLSTDNGSNITSRWRSGFADLGSTDIKAIREWRLEGIGTPTLKTSHDWGSLETGATVTLGTSPAIAEGRRRSAVRGREFSWQVGATSAWQLNNLVAHVREKRAPGTHNA